MKQTPKLWSEGQFENSDSVDGRRESTEPVRARQKELSGDMRQRMLETLVPSTIKIRPEYRIVVREARNRYLQRANNAEILMNQAIERNDPSAEEKHHKLWKSTMHRWIIAEELLVYPDETMTREEAEQECRNRMQSEFDREAFNEAWGVVHGYAVNGGDNVRGAGKKVRENYDARPLYMPSPEDNILPPKRQKKQRRKAA
jgi:hypothetical protein